ncbi:hypothetical protein PVAND_012205 [Polypedilum vanderplanki]|uniref:Uncharacterized protein n=1 Tax=Polypedilum vanderplanki TaxID=319348 RepID=A0A9J6CM21_POLVA|nr:hypothetical protein PVAND_012205 [Polypedilum vanderplanki]
MFLVKSKSVRVVSLNWQLSVDTQINVNQAYFSMLEELQGYEKLCANSVNFLGCANGVHTLQLKLDKVLELNNEIQEIIKMQKHSDVNAIDIGIVVEPMTIKKIDQNITITIPSWANGNFKDFLIKMSSLEKKIILMTQFCEQIIKKDVPIGKELEKKLKLTNDVLNLLNVQLPDFPLEKIIHFYEPKLWMRNDSICFNITIPILDKEKFHTYKVLNIPDDGYKFNISSEITMNEKNSTKLNLSKSKVSFIFSNIIYYQNVLKEPLNECEQDIFIISTLKSCSKIKDNNNMIIMLTEYEIFIYNRHYETVTLKCKNFSETIKSSQILVKLIPGCRITTQGFEYETLSDRELPSSHIAYPSLNYVFNFHKKNFTIENIFKSPM